MDMAVLVSLRTQRLRRSILKIGKSGRILNIHESQAKIIGGICYLGTMRLDYKVMSVEWMSLARRARRDKPHVWMSRER
jgi:hypothetical protein